MDIKIAISKEDINKCYQIRKTVFTDEQKYDESIDRDEYDNVAIHILLQKDSKPIGTCRCFIVDNYYKIGRFCILSEYRKQGYGKKMMHFLLDNLDKNIINLVKLSSQYDKYQFYEILGFKTLGEPYLEEGVKHILMIKCLDEDILSYRSQLNNIDDSIKDLFIKRMDIATKIANYKLYNDIAIEDLNREKEMIERLSKDTKYDKYYIEILKDTIKLSKDLQAEIIDKYNG